MNSENHDDNDATRISPAGINDLQRTITQKQDLDATIDVSATLKKEVTDNEATTIVTKNVIDNISEPASSELKTGSLLKNRFILREVLGSGGMGRVFRATDLRRLEAHDESPDVAIKVLNDEFKDNPELFIALQRETKKTQQLAHPNIVNVHDFDRDGDNVFMVMEVLEGKSLKEYISETASKGIAFKKAWPIIKGLALALAYAHKRNIVHSDFKPGNIFIKENGEVKVLDFGIACVATRSDKHSGDKTIFNARTLGALTPAYASLEMFENKDPDPRDDIYALACVTYELLSGKHPFGRLSAQKALEVNLQSPVISGLNRRQWNALSHALAFKREQRTSSISQFIDEIEPRSGLPSLLATITVIALLVAAGQYIYVNSTVDLVADKVIALTPEQELKIKDFLELAQIHFDVGYITAPAGSNASWAYHQVLDIDPYNKPAKEGLEKIADLVLQEAEKLFEDKKYNESLAKIEEGLEAIPKHEGLLQLKKQIMQQVTSKN
ncbi:MAG: serine/threonine-protein kinase [Methylococcaceae bacterium]